MSNIELQRDHKGKLHLVVGNQFAVGAEVHSLQPDNDGNLVAIVRIPLKDVIVSEMKNVLPFARHAG
jgi:hypothetical protein